MPEKLTAEIARRVEAQLIRALSGPIVVNFVSEEAERETHARWDAELEDKEIC